MNIFTEPQFLSHLHTGFLYYIPQWIRTREANQTVSIDQRTHISQSKKKLPYEQCIE